MARGCVLASIDKFVERVVNHYRKLEVPAKWIGADERRYLELQLKAESGYFVSARLHPREDHLVFEDEWGRMERLRLTRSTLDRILGWADESTRSQRKSVLSPRRTD